MNRQLQGAEFWVGDNVTARDSIRNGDLVFFERTGRHELVIHRVPEESTHIGAVYRAEGSPEEGTVHFVLIECRS